MPETSYFTPPLTTVRQDFGELGRLSMQLLVDRLSTGSQPPRHVVVSPDLVVRTSTDKPRT
jgi:DNA-binding LacI/PurR family transcriptional regulator